MYNASATKHQPTIRNVIRSTCFTPESVQVVVKPPEQSSTGREAANQAASLNLKFCLTIKSTLGALRSRARNGSAKQAKQSFRPIYTISEPPSVSNPHSSAGGRTRPVENRAPNDRSHLHGRPVRNAG